MHDKLGISVEWISVPCDGIGGAVKTTCSQAKPPKVFELSNLRLQSHPRFMWEWNDVDQVFGIYKESVFSVESL